jgi:RsiW-degrading membrane proteinase PrsW (M82 family)
MNTGVLSLICLIVALVMFALAAFFGYRYADGSRGWAVAVGLFFYALKDLVGAV